MKKYVVYTVILFNYDKLKDPAVVTEDVDYICFTDSEKLKSKTWNIIKVDKKRLDHHVKNRELKILAPYHVLKEYDYSLYIDGSFQIKKNLKTFFEKYNQYDFVIFKHPWRNCLYEEIITCIKLNKSDVNKLIEQYCHYSNEKVPANFGLSSSGIMFRNNKSQQIKKIMYEWFDQILTFSERDQPSLSYVLFKNNLNYNFFKENVEDNIYFDNFPHKNVSLLQIYYRKLICVSERNKMLKLLIYFCDITIKPLYLKLTNK